MKQNGFAPIYILIILLIAGGLGGAYYFSKSSNKSVISQINPTLTKSPIKAADGTVNWKTYNGDGFSFKYPPDAKVEISSSKEVFLNNNSKPPYFMFIVGTTNNSQNLTARQVFEEEIQLLRNNKNFPGGDTAKQLADYRESTIKEYKNGSITGYSMRWDRDGSSVSDAIKIVNISNNNIYKFSIHDGNGSVSQFQKDLLDKIISTFKFLPSQDQSANISLSSQNTLLLLKQITKLSIPGIKWQEAKKDNSVYFQKARSGYSQAGTLSQSQEKREDFINEEKLVENGWEKQGDIGFSPGGLLWRYKKEFGQKVRILDLSYQSYSFLRDQDPSDQEGYKPTEYSVFLSDEF